MKLYRTVFEEAQAECIIEKSRFICYVSPVEGREEAESFFERIKKENRSATHNVPAMVIGEKQQLQWASDDGEPQGTAGPPILQMLVNEGLTNVALMVTRYFGGIKLGTGGLVRAYTNSAKMGLEAGGYCEVRELVQLEIDIEYTYLSGIQKLAQDTKLMDIQGIEYAERVLVRAAVEEENKDEILGGIMNITKGQVDVKEMGVKKVKIKEERLNYCKI